EASSAHLVPDLIMEGYDNFNPAYYQQAVSFQNSLLKSWEPKNNADPEQALSSEIYIAGPKPQRISLNSEMKLIANSSNPTTMQKAVKDVKANFDTAGPVWMGNGNFKLKPNNPVETQQLYKHIDAVADGLSHHVTPPITKNETMLQKVDEV